MIIWVIFVIVLIACISFTNAFAFRMDEQAESLLYIQEAENAPDVPEISKPVKSPKESKNSEMNEVASAIQNEMCTSNKHSNNKSASERKTANKSGDAKTAHVIAEPTLEDCDFAEIDDDFIVIDSSTNNSKNVSQNLVKGNDDKSAGIMGKIGGNPSPNFSSGSSINKTIEEEADSFFNELLSEDFND